MGSRGSLIRFRVGAHLLERPGLALFETTELIELVVDAPRGDHDPNDGELCGTS